MAVSTFESKCGLSNGYIKNIKSSIGTNKIEDILKAYPLLDRIWLLTGEGSMLKERKDPALYNQIQEISARMKAKGIPMASFNKGVPYYNVDFVGGFDLVGNDQTVNPAYYIDFSPYNEDGTVWCNITGHSMEPRIDNGDMIALKEVQEWDKFLIYGEIYAVVAKNGMRTVKVINRGDDKDSFKLVPINESGKYSIQDIPKNMIEKVFKVMGCMKRL